MGVRPKRYIVINISPYSVVDNNKKKGSTLDRLLPKPGIETKLTLKGNCASIESISIVSTCGISIN
jgi:hypothetical protein